MSRPRDPDSAAERPCVWMQAGVLTYRLCDRDYECDTCELYHALHGTAGARLPEDVPPLGRRGDTEADVIDHFVRQLIDGCTLHLDRAYSRGHFWLQARDDGTLDVGLAAHVLRFLCTVDDLVLPRVGVRLRRGDPCGWITHGRVSVPLAAPISGDVVAVHDEAVAVVRQSGGREDGRWLYRTRPLEDPEHAPGLRHGEDAVALYLETVHVVKRYLRDAEVPAQAAGVGHTLADGGTPAGDLEAVLGQDRYERLVDELFHMQI